MTTTQKLLTGTELDHAVRTISAFTDFADLLNSIYYHHYTPSLYMARGRGTRTRNRMVLQVRQALLVRDLPVYPATLPPDLL